MPNSLNTRFAVKAFSVTVVLLSFTIFWPFAFRGLPHGHCWYWIPWITALHNISDLLIMAAYYAIPFCMWWGVKKRPDLFENSIYTIWMFMAFIVACGTTHLLDYIVVYHPIYVRQGIIKAITAVISLITLAMLFRERNQIQTIISAAQLREVVNKLEERLAFLQSAEPGADIAKSRDEAIHALDSIVRTIKDIAGVIPN